MLFSPTFHLQDALLLEICTIEIIVFSWIYALENATNLTDKPYNDGSLSSEYDFTNLVSAAVSTQKIDLQGKAKALGFAKVAFHKVW